MTEDAPSLADDLEAVLREVPGVTAVYPSASIPAVLIGEVLAPTVLPVTTPPLVTVSSHNNGTTVTALIGVTDDLPALETGLAAHTQLAEHLSADGPTAEVTVRIGLIAG